MLRRATPETRPAWRTVRGFSAELRQAAEACEAFDPGGAPGPAGGQAQGDAAAVADEPAGYDEQAPAEGRLGLRGGVFESQEASSSARGWRPARRSRTRRRWRRSGRLAGGAARRLCGRGWRARRRRAGGARARPGERFCAVGDEREVAPVGPERGLRADQPRAAHDQAPLAQQRLGDLRDARLRGSRRGAARPLSGIGSIGGAYVGLHGHADRVADLVPLERARSCRTTRSPSRRAAGSRPPRRRGARARPARRRSAWRRAGYWPSPYAAGCAASRACRRASRRSGGSRACGCSRSPRPACGRRGPRTRTSRHRSRAARARPGAGLPGAPQRLARAHDRAGAHART